MKNYLFILCVSLLLCSCACRRYEQVNFGWEPKQGIVVTVDEYQALNDCVNLQQKHQPSVNVYLYLRPL